MPREISAAYLERKLRAIVGVQGSNPLPDLSDVSTGLVVLESDRIEWGRAGGESYWATGLNAPASLNERSFVTIENPLGSGTLVVVEEVHSEINPTGGASNPFQVFVQRQPNAPLNAVPNQAQVTTAFCRDLRLGNDASSAILRQGRGSLAVILASNVMTATGIQLAGVNVALHDYFVSRWVLPPNSRLWFVGLADNTQIQVGVMHRERPLEGQLEIR